MDLSIVLEWENVFLADDERCFLMLRKLARQLEEVCRSSELIVLFNPEQMDRDRLEEVLSKYFEQESLGRSTALRIEESKGSHYYTLKNEGVAYACGEIIVFVDSDIVPEGNWLKELTAPFFDHPEINVLAGHTYLSHDTLVEKSFALGWLFPLRNDQDSLHTSRARFFANNVAFRRKVISEHPFPDLPAGVTRGACYLLAKTLVSSGITIWTNTAARVVHPPPSCFQHYMVRALAEGRDDVLGGSRPARTRLSSLRRSCRRTRKKITASWCKIKSQRGRVALAIWQTPGAYIVMTCFYLITFFGSFAAILFPTYAKTHWRI